MDLWERQRQRAKEIKEVKIGSSLYVQKENEIDEYKVVSETKTLWKIAFVYTYETDRVSSLKSIHKEDLRDKSSYSTTYYYTRVTQEMINEIEGNKKRAELFKFLDEATTNLKRGKGNFSDLEEDLLAVFKKHKED
jgi:hypothetical protein